MDTNANLSVNVLGGSSTVDTAMIGGLAGCVWTGLAIKGHRITTDAGTPVMVSFTGNGGTISDADLDCKAWPSVSGPWLRHQRHAAPARHRDAVTNSTIQHKTSGVMRVTGALEVGNSPPDRAESASPAIPRSTICQLVVRLRTACCLTAPTTSTSVT